MVENDISSVSTLKNTHLKSPCLCFRVYFTMCDLCAIALKVHRWEGSHMRTSRYGWSTIRGPYQSQWKLFLYPSGGFYSPFIILFAWLGEITVFSLWAKQSRDYAPYIQQSISARMFNHFCVGPILSASVLIPLLWYTNEYTAPAFLLWKYKQFNTWWTGPHIQVFYSVFF